MTTDRLDSDLDRLRELPGVTGAFLVPASDQIDEFMGKLRDEEDADHAQLHLLRGAPAGWHRSVDELLERLDAFQLGLEDAGDPSL